MRPVTLFKSIVGFLAFGQCHADVTWGTIGCGATRIDGKNIDQIWDNAVALSSNAQSKLDDLLGTALIHSRDGPIAKIASHVRSMFKFEYRFDRLGAIPSGSKGDLETIRNNFKLVQEKMGGNNGYLVCSGADFQFTDDEPVSSGGWYFVIPGTENRIYLSTFIGLPNGANRRPCSDPGDLGKTFKGQHVIGGGLNPWMFQLVLFCDNNHIGRKKGTLEPGFATTGDKPDPNAYGSASGTILHEMFHVVGEKFFDKPIPNSPETEDIAYTYNPCYWLSLEDSVGAILNPDNYRILAEMLMSHLTSWAPPTERA